MGIGNQLEERQLPATQANITPEKAYQHIVGRLAKLGAHRRRVRLISGMGLMVSVALAAAIFCLGVDALLFLSPLARQILLVLSGVGLLFVLTGFVLFPVIKGPSLENLARMADAHYARMRNGLVAALQLWGKKKGRMEGYSEELIDAAVLFVERHSRDVDLRAVVKRTGMMRMLSLGTGLFILAVVLLAFFSAPLRSSAHRFQHPRTHFRQPPRTHLDVAPGDVQVTRHSDVQVSARISGKIPDQVNIRWKEGEARWRDGICDPRQEREFGYLFADVKRDIVYQVTAGGAQSPVYRIAVIDRPRVVKLRLRYQFPTYTRLDAQVIEDDGNISAVVGTAVQLEVEANKELAEAWLSLAVDKRVDLTCSGGRAEGQLMIRQDGAYSIHLVDGLGNENKDPIRYRIEAIKDDPPMVQITFPGENVDLGEEMKLPLSVVAQDDFGLSRVELVSQKIREGEQFSPERSVLALPRPDETRIELEYLWDLAGLDVIPEDVVAYHVEVWDNDRISGPKRAESRTYTVRFPSIHEILTQVQEEQSIQVVDLEDILREEQLLKDRLDQIRRELEIEDQMSWEQKKDVESALERQGEIAQELAQIAQDMDQTIQSIQEKRLASAEIMEKMHQVRELMEEVATPEMKRALEELQKALQELDPELIKQQLDRFNITQEDLLKRLDRTLSVLKRLQVEQRLDALIKKAEEMAQRLERIQEETEKVSQDALKELAQEQENLRQDAEALPGAMTDLSEMMCQFPEMPSQELSELAQEMESSEMASQMSESAQNLSRGRRRSAQICQKKAARILDQLYNGLQMMQSQMGQKMREEIAKAIKNSVRDLLDISREQEYQYAQAKGLDHESTAFGQLAEDQLHLLETTSRVAEDLYGVAQKTFFVTPQVGQALGRALSQMGQAIDALEQRKESAAAHAERAAMVSLNEAAQNLIAGLNALSCPCSSSGLEAMLQQLEGMSQGQMSINTQTLGMGQQGQYSMEQRAQMARLAAEQEVLRRSLEDLLQEFGNRSEILGRLDDLGEEMKQVVDDLSRSAVDQKTIDRQEKILSRLLDAQKSVRRRDYTHRRQSRPGEVVVRPGPGDLPPGLGEGEDQLRQDLLRALDEDYPKAYQDLIRAYFQALSRTR